MKARLSTDGGARGNPGPAAYGYVLEAARLARQLDRVTYNAVRREHNDLADRLVNEALDAAG